MDKNFKNYLYIDKIDYVKNKKQGNCIFCNSDSIKNTLINEFNDFLIVLNKYPFNPGHLLVIPKRHVEDIDELSENEFITLFELIKLSKKILNKIYAPDGFNIGLNLGDAAGGSIKHLHVHLVPRFRSEVNFLEVTSSTRVIVEKLEDTLQKLQYEFNKLK